MDVKSYHMGTTLVEMLLDQIKDNTKTKAAVFSTEFIFRQTTKKLNQNR